MRKHPLLRKKVPCLMERINSGIQGFDKLVGGGIPKKDLVLLSGTCGSGKTIFGLGFLHTDKAKSGIYISFEESIDLIKETSASLGFKTYELEKSDKIRFLKYDPFKIEDIFEVIENNIREIRAERVVIDSISSIGLYVKDASELRRMILQISSMLRKNGCTSLLISETLPNRDALSRFGVEEFVTDGVIRLHNFFISGEYRRGISIWKMRSTNHSRKVHPYDITGKGFIVYPDDTMVVNR